MGINRWEAYIGGTCRGHRSARGTSGRCSPGSPAFSTRRIRQVTRVDKCALAATQRWRSRVGSKRVADRPNCCHHPVGGRVDRATLELALRIVWRGPESNTRPLHCEFRPVDPLTCDEIHICPGDSLFRLTTRDPYSCPIVFAATNLASKRRMPSASTSRSGQASGSARRPTVSWPS